MEKPFNPSAILYSSLDSFAEADDVVADIAHQMLVGPRVAADDVQHEAGQKEKTDGTEDVGQKLLGKDVVSVSPAVGSSVVHRHLLVVRLVGA